MALNFDEFSTKLSAIFNVFRKNSDVITTSLLITSQFQSYLLLFLNYRQGNNALNAKFYRLCGGAEA
jgi:hypothetical protein